ncbi:MAG: beta/gamma crystallin family protein [Robiginitomaculum sp.]|nr:beta/gamma crystallin family protein [Robiginitomaculum sp.]
MKYTNVIRAAIGVIIAAALGSPASSDSPIRSPGIIAEITLFSDTGNSGRSQTFRSDQRNLSRYGFSDKAQSILVSGGQWELCQDSRYRGRCEVFSSGQYNLKALGWGTRISSLQQVRSGTDTITLYSEPNFHGYSRTYARKMDKLKNYGFINKTASLRITGGIWKVCTNSGMSGRCELVDRDYSELQSIGMSYRIAAVGPQSERIGRYDPNNGQIVLFEGREYKGTRVTIRGEVSDLRRSGFADRTSSIQLQNGQWEVCENAFFGGRCEIIDYSVNDLSRLRLNNRISSIRPVTLPAPTEPGYDPAPGWQSGNNISQGVEGQRTVFFPEPTINGDTIAECLYPNRQCGQQAATEFCRIAGLRTSVYFETARGYKSPKFLGRGARQTRRNQSPYLVDVLCSR